MTKENLLKYLRDPAYLHQVSYQELKTLVAEYPNSLSLRYLLAIKSKQENNGDLDRQLAFLATYSIDRAHLFDVFNKEEELALQEDSVLLQEDFLELKELSTLERELSTSALVQATSTKEVEPAFLPNNDYYKEVPIKEAQIVSEQVEIKEQLEEEFYVLNFDKETEIAENNTVTEVVISDTQVADNLAAIEDLFKDLEEEEEVEVQEESATINASINNSKLLQETLISGTFSDIPLEIIATNVSIIGENSTEPGDAVTDKEVRTVSIDYLQQIGQPNKKEVSLSNEQILSDNAIPSQIPAPQQLKELGIDASKYKEQPIIYSLDSIDERYPEPITEAAAADNEAQQASKNSLQKEEQNNIVEEQNTKSIERITIFEKSTIISTASSLSNGVEAIDIQGDHLKKVADSTLKENNVASVTMDLVEEIATTGLPSENIEATPITEQFNSDDIETSDLVTQESETTVIDRPALEEEEQTVAPIPVEESFKIKPLPKSSFTTWYKQSPVSNIDFAGYDLVGFNSKGIIDEVITKDKVLPKEEEIPEKEPEKTVTIRKVTSRADKSLEFEEDIASETLAHLLVLQGHYSKATAMYEQLSLIFPEKSGLFADEIKKIQNLEDEVA